jgi:hypothetical protein
MMPPPTGDGTVPQAPRELSEAASFLHLFGDDHFLCSIDPKSGDFRSQRGSTDRVVRWARSENEQGRNIYYHLNEVRSGEIKKASKADITLICGVPEDVDWGWQQYSGRYRERLTQLAELQVQLRQSATPPTLSVFTGGGFQNVYLLKVPLAATPEIIGRVAALSRSLVAERGGDMVGTPEHLLRMPGFTNYPKPKKALAGQPEVMASITFSSGRTYSLEELESAFLKPDVTSWGNLGSQAGCFNGQTFTDELSAGIDTRPLDMEAITAAAHCLPRVGKYCVLVDGQRDVRSYDLSKRDDWLVCAVFPAAYGMVQHPEHETLIRDLFHTVSAKGVAGNYDSSSGVGEENDNKLDDEIARIRNGCSRPDHPTLYRWISMLEESGGANPGSGASDSGRTGHGGTSQGAGGPGGQENVQRRTVSIEAAPFVWADPAGLPRRKWIYDRHYIRRYVSATIARGGVGKSALGIVEALAITTGRDLLGVRPSERANVWLWNGEDPLDELQRRITGAALHHGISPADIEGRLFVNSGRDTAIIIATETKDGTLINGPVVEEVVRTIRDHEIGLVVIDPFVSSHRVSENDNNKIDTVVKTWARIAEETDCAIDLVHHSRKTNGADATVEDARGASALNAAARSVRVLNSMTPKEAENAGVQNPRQYVRIENGKANLAPPSDKAKWFHLRSVSLGNGSPSAPSDEVGVAEAWDWPNALAGVTDAHLRAVKQAFAGRPWRKDAQARDWAGHPVATGLGLNLHDAAHKAKVKRLIKDWLVNGMLAQTSGKSGKGKTCPFVQVGTWPV